MYTFFLATAVLGAAVLVLQVIISLSGLGHGMDAELDMEGGLSLLSVRAIAAGVSAFGLAGMTALEFGLPVPLAWAGGVPVALTAALVVAWLTRRMVMLEASGTLRLERAVGSGGRVHVSVPARGEGAGRVQFELQGRTVEMKAVAAAEPIPTGSPVTIVALLDADTVEVMPTPTIEEILG